MINGHTIIILLSWYEENQCCFNTLLFKWYFLKVVLNSGAREMAQTVKTVVLKVE